MTTDFVNFRLDSPTGASLNTFASEAATRPKAIVQIGHGMSEHAARYARLAAALSEAGYHAIAHDHRGHGHTTAPGAPRGIFAVARGADQVIADMLAVNTHARERWPDLPLFYFGHSMGTIIGTNYCIRHSQTLDGAALWNASMDTGLLMAVFRLLLKGERALKGSDTPSRIATRLTFEDWNAKFKPNRTDFDWLSRDEAEVDKYVADPLCGFPCSTGLWLDVTGMVLAGASDTELSRIRKDLPMFLLGGGADPYSDRGRAMTRLADRLRKTGVRDVTDAILPGARHESLNEINRDEATAMLVGWLDAHVQDAPV